MTESEDLVEIQPPDPVTLAKRLIDIRNSPGESDKKRERILHVAVGLVNSAGIIFSEEREGAVRVRERFISRQAMGWSNDIEGECMQCARQAIDEGKAVVIRLENAPAVRIISCPGIEGNEGKACCLSAIVLLGDAATEPFLIILQLLTAFLVQVETEAGPRHKVPGAPLELADCFSPSATWSHHQLVDYLRSWASCSVLAVGVRNTKGTTHLHSVTDLVEVEAKTEQGRLYLQVMEECLRRGETISWPGEPGHDENGISLVMKELLQAVRMAQGTAIALPGIGGTATVLVMLWQQVQKHRPEVDEIDRLAGLAGPAVHELLTGNRNKKRGSAKGRMKKIIAGICCCGLLAAAALLPVPYTISQQCWLEPLDVRFVVARFNGLVDNVHTEPGAKVVAGQELAALDGREIQLELASLDADMSKADKVHDSYMAEGDVAGAQMARLEYEMLQERQTLLLDRLDRLQLRSPVDGVVLDGDLKKKKGGPVERGQVLFEIAPLEEVELEIGVADEDISSIREGMQVTARFEAFPERVWPGSIAKISPKSSLVEGNNLFIASLHLDNKEGLLQPGMHGQAVVTSDRKPLAWIYFHKPWYRLKRLLFSIF